MTQSTAFDWEQHKSDKDVSDISAKYIIKGIDIRARERIFGSLNDVDFNLILRIIDSLVESRPSHGLRTDRTGNTWAKRAFETAFSPPEEKVMIEGNIPKNKDLIARLDLAHQRFIKSGLAQDLKSNCKPEMSREELLKEIANIETPISNKIYEGRDR